MRLKPVDIVDQVSPEVFRTDYYNQSRPIVIRDLAKEWSAFQKWNWNFIRSQVGNIEVGVYNNIRSDAYTPINKADGYMLFGDYLDLIQQGPVELRIFLFNIFSHAPHLTEDFSWPDHLMKGYAKRFPMLFVGGQGSVTHMHFDIDLSHILHTQFMGRKRVLLFPFDQQRHLYRKPFEVLSLVNFEKYYDPRASKMDLEKFPALKQANGYEVILEHGDTLFMPAGYWHHMEYIDSGFAMSLRAFQSTIGGMLKGAWNLIGMRNIDSFMKCAVPEWWFNYKQERSMMAAGHEKT